MARSFRAKCFRGMNDRPSIRARPACPRPVDDCFRVLRRALIAVECSLVPRVRPNRAEADRAEPSRVERRQAETNRVEPGRVGSGRVGSSRAESSRAEPRLAETRQAEANRAEPSRAEPSRAEPSTAEPSKLREPPSSAKRPSPASMVRIVFGGIVNRWRVLPVTGHSTCGRRGSGIAGEGQNTAVLTGDDGCPPRARSYGCVRCAMAE